MNRMSLVVASTAGAMGALVGSLAVPSAVNFLGLEMTMVLTGTLILLLILLVSVLIIGLVGWWWGELATGVSILAIAITASGFLAQPMVPHWVTLVVTGVLSTGITVFFITTNTTFKKNGEDFRWRETVIQGAVPIAITAVTVTNQGFGYLSMDPVFQLLGL